MIEFMILGPPRSGTTWAANWLTTDTTLCIHDPLFRYHPEELDDIKSKRRVGISCTATPFWPAFVHQHPARKVILHRNNVEVARAMAQIGGDDRLFDWEALLSTLPGLHVDWRELWEAPRRIYETLLGIEFDEERHRELKQMHIQPDFEMVEYNKQSFQRLMKELTTP